MTQPDSDSDRCLWTDIDAEDAIEVTIKAYGKDAPMAAAACALGAHRDGREEDYRFWTEIFKRLTGAGHA